MKKRILALLLALVLVLAAVPFAFAEENVDEEEAYTPELALYEEDHLLGMGYYNLQNDDDIAVGDELWIHYLDPLPADVFVNGEQVHHFVADEWEAYCYTVRNTGPLEISVQRDGEVLLARNYNVISSADMYKRVAKQAFKDLFVWDLEPMSLEEIKDAANHGFPIGNPFLPFAFVAMVTFNFFHAIFSFVRIVR